MKKAKLIFLVLFLLSSGLIAQKAPLDKNVYDSWKSLSASKISDDGQWISYNILPQQGDGWLYIYNVKTGKKDSVARGKDASFSPNSEYIACLIVPEYLVTRQAKKKKLKEDKMPKNNLEIRLLRNGHVYKAERVKSFSVPSKKSAWMAYLHEKKITGENKDKKEVDSSSVSASSAKSKHEESEKNGTEFVIFNPVTDREYRYQDVTEYEVSDNGNSIAFIQSIPDSTKIKTFIVNIFDTGKESVSKVFEGKGDVEKVTCDKAGEQLGFIYSPDTSKIKVYDLYLSADGKEAHRVVDMQSLNMPSGWSVSENGKLSFSDNGSRLFFGTASKPEKEPEDTLIADEKYHLDIWSWSDDIIQPMQKKQLDQEKKRTWLAVYDIRDEKMVQLGDSLVPVVRTVNKGQGDLALGSNDIKYRKESSWEGSIANDYYLVDMSSGSKTLLLEKCPERAYLSPACNYVVYWDDQTKAWMSISVADKTKRDLTSSLDVPFYNELNDVPSEPRPYGIAGWLNDDRHLLVYDRFDIWSLDLTGKEDPVNITESIGRNNYIRFRYVKIDPDEEFIPANKTMILSAFNTDNKQSGFYSLTRARAAEPNELVMEKASFPGDPLKAKNADVLIWQKGTFENYPELYVSNIDFKGYRKISVTNPQQAQYNWGSPELVEWMSYDHQKLQGILYKPENFDPAKKYPMIVYFYERSSDGLYNYVTPAPSASIINKTFAVSNGYLIFVPDITYVTGYPGQSCYNAVMSGTHALLERYSFIDRDRLGLDGQSWGGYQIAYLVTQTDLFKCAFSGAPVSDMISAYGGIRWGTGMSRQFQYEKSQSRIGGTLWEKPMQYIENSPVYWVPKIHTPLLIMHNDADGAVPWYQGIEFIMALRRLNKPAWMLSYNDEDHNLVRRADRKDLSIRKMQFFDHYLKGTPMPYWMKNGITQLQKGKIDGYNLVNY
jgi:dipeptidyl aminopeptidase/acylaminoacyl peptidase